ncbi:MAG: F0F1 ATP synthase subunit epsilon, partial [Anaeroplasmataceae bacterium]
QGKTYDQEIEYVVIKNQDGEFALLNNHVPLVAVIKDGYIKMVNNKEEEFAVIINGFLEYKNNVVNVIAQEANVGKDYKTALEHIKSLRLERLNLNKKANVEFTQKESELIENIKSAKSGSL